MALSTPTHLGVAMLVMLNTWDGAVKFLGNSKGSSKPTGKPVKPLDIAIMLGWTRINATAGLIMSDVATACAAAFALISGGYQGRQDCHRVSVHAAMEIATRAQELMRQTELSGRLHKVEREEIEAAKHHFGRAAVAAAG